ncbi:membrane protein insertion efficiency factor YidD [Helicobacter apodemus]|uniref:Putative membrane protein insertion efficiency factor n=1 Tax=Helicobacter apodemus TaxID=135569 RepID=A0A4U8UGZ3_9HELI|nr:membrane protein insertion efficiency factor YidD [Helicobacter apodemus]TLE15746.1 membrane protein insertion efficiency factor YidD [Helicobacter apodemus]
MLKKVSKVSINIINFYQCYISVLLGAKCRYYPSCSEYSKQIFHFHNPFVAFYKTLLRILSCNQFFQGGINYPKATLFIQPIFTSPKHFNFWLIPTQPILFSLKNFTKQQVYIIKNLSKDPSV